MSMVLALLPILHTVRRCVMALIAWVLIVGGLCLWIMSDATERENRR